MKLFIGLLVAAVAFNGVLSLPALNPSDDAEVIGYPRRVSTRTEAEDDDDFNDFKGVIDTGSGYPFLQPNPSILNFGFFDSFDDLFRRFRTRLWPVAVLGRGGEDSDEDSGSGSFGIATNFDPKKANTTSTVKVVDGHKVEVNETVYGDEHSVFKVRVVNVRPLEEGETVEETVKTSSNSDQKPNVKPVTSRPETSSSNSDEDDDEGRREPLAKKSKDNEIQGNIDDPEHLSVTENIVEATTTTTATIDDDEDNDDTMLPTTNTEDLAFVTDNILAARVEADELNDNGNGNNEFETNMSSMGNGGENAADIGYNDDAIATATDNTVAIENNEDTEEVDDNLNESSSTSDVAASDSDGNADDDDDDDDGAQAVAADNNEGNEFNDVEDAEDGDDVDDNASIRGKIIKSNVKHSNYAVIRNKQREDATSSDEDDDDDRAAVEMHPTFNDEWGTFNENIDNKENNDLSNDIDVYDVEPIDLSNDIAVNDAANLPINPDAELLYNIGGEHNLHQMPKFEKLSLSEASADNSEHLSSFSGEMK